MLRGRRRPPRRAARARLPVRRRGRRLHRRARHACSSSSRTATRSCASLLVNELEIDPARLVPVLHYDGTPITARFITTAIGRAASRADSRRSRSPKTRSWPHDLPRQTEAAPSDAAAATSSASRGATTKARSRRCAPAAATTRSRPRSSRRAGSSTSSRTASPSCRASAARSKTPDYFLGALARLQHRARPHAVGADRRQPRQPRPASTSASPATAIRRRSASASSRTRCAAA